LRTDDQGFILLQPEFGEPLPDRDLRSILVPLAMARRFSRTAGFTLLEILASIALLVFLIIFIGQIVVNATSVTGTSRNQLDSDSQARLVMDRIEQDISAMVKNPGVDYFVNNGTSGPLPNPTINDTMFFYSQVPGYPLNDPAATVSDLSLVGYRINPTSWKLERYGKATSWDGNEGTPFLTYSATGNLLPETTLANNPIVSANSNDANYHVLADGVFRIEICYLLKDGSYSTAPVLYNNPTTWGGGNFYNTAGGPPTPSDASTGVGLGYQAGSRWYDSSAKRGYICQNATPGKAVWKAIGWQDVSAIIVTIAVMDQADLTILSGANKHISDVAPKFVKAQDRSTTLPAQNWQTAVDSGSLNALLPAKAAAGIRIYQRYFNVNSQ
jgi:type II secretory pathway pseudopilin PulG